MSAEQKFKAGAAGGATSGADGAQRCGAGLGRRSFLRLAAVLTLGLLPLPPALCAQLGRSVGRGGQLPPPPPGRRRNPRFRRKKSKPYVSRLAPGFYLNRRTQVVHYVGSGGRIANVSKINERNLQPLSLADLTRLAAADGGARVNLNTSSHAFEQAALLRIRAGDNETACSLLVSAVRHDQLLKRKTPEYPSLRLYDLLAGTAARFGLQRQYDEMLALSRSMQAAPAYVALPGRAPKRNPATHPPRPHRVAKLQRKAARKAAQASKRSALIASRISKWGRPDSRWRQHWRDVKGAFPWFAKV